jgi:hypothetical protein
MWLPSIGVAHYWLGKTSLRGYLTDNNLLGLSLFILVLNTRLHMMNRVAILFQPFPSAMVNIIVMKNIFYAVLRLHQVLLITPSVRRESDA